jgi:crotonobetaine/carnitine-CoA ligase
MSDSIEIAPIAAEAVARYQFHGQDVGRLLDQRAANRGDHPFLVWEPKGGSVRTWTYAEFAEETRKAVAAGLSRAGRRRWRCGAHPRRELPRGRHAWYAVARVGGVAVTTNTRSVAAELSYFIEHSGAVGAITQPQFAAVVAEAGPDLAWIVVHRRQLRRRAGDDEADHALERFDAIAGDPRMPCPPSTRPAAAGGILFTSGTTSKPKAVVHTHANVLWSGKVNPPTSTSGRRHLPVLSAVFPRQHPGWAIWTVLGAGGTVVLQPKFSASGFWDVIEKHSVTHISLIPFVIQGVRAGPIPETTPSRWACSA